MHLHILKQAQTPLCFICTCISATSDIETCRSQFTGLHCELKVFNSGNEILLLGLQLGTPPHRKKSLSLISSSRKPKTWAGRNRSFAANTRIADLRSLLDKVLEQKLVSPEWL